MPLLWPEWLCCLLTAEGVALEWAAPLRFPLRGYSLLSQKLPETLLLLIDQREEQNLRVSLGYDSTFLSSFLH